MYNHLAISAASSGNGLENACTSDEGVCSLLPPPYRQVSHSRTCVIEWSPNKLGQDEDSRSRWAYARHWRTCTSIETVGTSCPTVGSPHTKDLEKDWSIQLQGKFLRLSCVLRDRLSLNVYRSNWKTQVSTQTYCIIVLCRTACTFANIVFPVPGGPYIKMFWYNPPFRFVFIVDLATDLIFSSNWG